MKKESDLSGSEYFSMDSEDSAPEDVPIASKPVDDSEDSAPEDVPIASEPVDDMFNKRLTAKKIKQERKQDKNITKLKPLPQEVINQLSEKFPKTVLPSVYLTGNIKKKTLKPSKKDTGNKTSSTITLKKLPDFIPLKNVPAKCSTNFKVGVLDAIVKNPMSINHKDYILYHSKQGKDRRRTNVKDSIIKKGLIKRLNSR